MFTHSVTNLPPINDEVLRPSKETNDKAAIDGILTRMRHKYFQRIEEK